MNQMRPEDLIRMQWVETAACAAPPGRQVLFYSEMTGGFFLGHFDAAGQIVLPAMTLPEEREDLALAYWMPLCWLPTPDVVLVNRSWVEHLTEAIGQDPFAVSGRPETLSSGRDGA